MSMMGRDDAEEASKEVVEEVHAACIVVVVCGFLLVSPVNEWAKEFQDLFFLFSFDFDQRKKRKLAHTSAQICFLLICCIQL